MPIIIALLIIIILILFPAIFGITVVAISTLIYLLIKLSIPLFVCITLLTCLHLFEKGNSSIKIKRIKFFVSLFVVISTSLILWLSGLYFASYLVLILSFIYIICKNSGVFHAASNEKWNADSIINKTMYIVISTFYFQQLFIPIPFSSHKIQNTESVSSFTFLIYTIIILSPFIYWIFNVSENNIIQISKIKKSISLLPQKKRFIISLIPSMIMAIVLNYIYPIFYNAIHEMILYNQIAGQ